MKVEAPPRAPLSVEATGVTLTGVTRRYATRRGASLTALADLELSLTGGEVLGVVGPSGCGKSTLLELVAGLQEPDAGRVSVGERDDARERRDACALMPQRDLLLPWRDALGNAGLALEARGVAARAARARAMPLFERFGLAGFERARPTALSGGMRQRVAFVRTLLAGRPVLLLDEPFAALDAITRAEMQQWLADALAAEPRTVVLVTHDVEEALFLADRVAVLSPRPGRVVTELDVPYPRPRDRRAAVTDPELARLRGRALEALG
ncbi:MAG TPA: ABC transporter ATP-binding protein [Thermoleophilaceae bacterium]|nr:ABC transporter ATP-binding protein [Thermoleophilaceae bacterium]